MDRRTYDRIAASRAEKTFTTIEDVWRRAGVPMGTLYHIAAADGFHSRGDEAKHSRADCRKGGRPVLTLPADRAA